MFNEVIAASNKNTLLIPSGLKLFAETWCNQDFSISAKTTSYFVIME